MFGKSYFALPCILSAITMVSGVDVMLVVDCKLRVKPATNGSIYISSIDATSSDPFNFQALPLQGIRHPVAVDFDPNKGKVYWTDYTDQSISRAYLNGSQQQVLVSDLGHSTGLAIDHVSHVMYWTDETRQNIGKANMDGTNQTIFLDSLEHNPRPIVINSNSGHIYWAEFDKITKRDSKIMRVLRDGSDMTTLVQSDLVYPNGLSLDLEGNFLYWCDAGTDKIERSSLNGENRVVIYHNDIYDMMPFDLALYKDYLYWTDWSDPPISLTRVHINNQPGPINTGGPVGGTFEMGTGIHIQTDFSWLCLSNPCLNGATCLDNLTSFSCICPSGYLGNTCQTASTISVVTEVSAGTPLRTTKTHTNSDHNGDYLSSASTISVVTEVSAGTPLRTTKTHTNSDHNGDYLSSVTYQSTMSPTHSATNVKYQARGHDYKLVHYVTTIAVWTLLSIVIFAVLVITYRKIPCHKNFQILNEMSTETYADKSSEVYDTVSEIKPREDYATSIHLKIEGYDNPGYINAHGMAGFQPRYVNLLPPNGDSDTNQSADMQPPDPPPITKLDQLKQSQQKD